MKTLPFLAAGLFVFASALHAQDEALADPAAEAASEEAAPPAPSYESGIKGKPLPAEKSPRALRGLLLDIAYTGERLVAVGERGNIVASRDGVRWAQVAVPSRSTLTGVHFVDRKHGWATGHDMSILRTTDGGRTWELLNFDPQTLQPLHDVFFLDASRGFAFGAFGTFLGTTDGGKTWTSVVAPAVLEEGYHLNGMTKLADGQLLLVGESGLLGISTDGSTWDRLPSPYEGSFFGVVPRGDKGALVFGLRGNAYVSDDVRAGNWRRVELGTLSSIFGGAAMDDGAIVLVGADASVLTVRADDTVQRLSTQAGAASSGTISSVTRWPGGLMTVGESGVQAYAGSAGSGAPAAAAQALDVTDEFN